MLIASDQPGPVDVSICIVNWNGAALLGPLLDSIAASRGDVGIEVVIVDNHSQDGSAALVRERFPGVALICNSENAGFSRA